MLLQTSLEHVISEENHKNIIAEHEDVMICCGRMGPMCTPVYTAMETLKPDYENVKFYDMAFDSSFSHVIRDLPECSNFMGLPFTVYYKNGKVVHATSSIQDTKQVQTILDDRFGE
ncbi:MAG: thioredoxin [Candidatus Marinimicrobia bacterium]|jgi:thioredoxin 1|nr:thioredoxin [Candidatus Neomarinimicrobiota bacterium]MBT3691593.1 thioredoxin [Candidatus Neomarinimicrobiota bacterium]MBT3731464.1 thioredoxin [Candidatus Neomarinimicrobiota bacterium]MBT4144166.1 thioredoxin [Candidatus Neomarinimicrobiota bacterium]MBT4178531.1 thioredoxin [Candidatus Neomarinimicrobiota bacterium]